MKKSLLLAAAAFIALQACRKTPDGLPAPDLEDDGLTEEAAQISSMYESHRALENGELKAQLDTNSLAPVARYVVLYKSSFRAPLAETYTGDDEGKEAAAFANERNAKAAIRNRYTPDVVPESSVLSWYSVLSTGFYAELTPEQVKTLYRDTAVKAINIPPDYETEGDDVVYDEGSKPLFIHGYKNVTASNTKRIWIIDNGGSQLSPYTNDDPLCKSFVANAINVNSDHGNNVAHIAAATMFGPGNMRGTAAGARIVMLKAGDGSTLTWDGVIKALEYCWTYSKKGDIVNMSLSAPASSAAVVVEMENNILDFETWDMPIVMAGGNQNTFASNRTPARLGNMYKDDALKYKFLYVVANCTPTGTTAEVKARTCTFVLNADASSNYGRAIRYGLVGTWNRRSTAGVISIGSGTSFSAPALAGILYHSNPSVSNCKDVTNVLRYKKGSTTYSHLVPTLF